MVSLWDQGGQGALSPFCLTRVAILPNLTGIPSGWPDRRPWSHHGLVGQCQVFPAPLQPQQYHNMFQRRKKKMGLRSVSPRFYVYLCCNNNMNSLYVDHHYMRYHMVEKQRLGNICLTLL